MPSMIAVAKKAHAEKIAEAIAPAGSRRQKDLAKDLMKLNYSTLVELSPKVRKGR